MKIVIISDIHANYDAWRALPEDYDELWVLGDLVNYGPQPTERCQKRFHLTHATPSNPLYDRCSADQWMEEMETTAADILLVGHTHVPFIRRIGEKIVLNPGSVGQTRTGGSLASYAGWWNGESN